MPSQCPQQTDAFRDLYRIFASRDGRVLEFEILPSALGPILEDDCSIGITKKYLVQAFVTARRVFFDTLKLPYNGNHGIRETPEQEHLDEDQNLAIASEIILLFDCEHLTACNWRKRRLRALLRTGQETLISALNTELSLMTTYLCSPLPRHTKSPTLWQHRLWVRTQLIELRKPDFQASQELFQIELSVALRAGELHPRNYYAFNYMRQIHRTVSESGAGETGVWSVRLGQAIIMSTLDWCLAHPTDISGLMFLLYVLDVVPDAPLRLDIASKVARFSLDIGWEGEGVWTFLDLAVRKFSLADSLGESQIYPWDILLNPILSDRSHQGDSKTGMPWRMWLDRARIHWAQTR
ncbi:hypothetical protein BDW59DRAFT_77732 [Aspergillus cavernicola]|uniref:Protein prenyltransferase n=1 Tax=Aspergillus cavernicola TaxID=176166 RepID=A0ABR4J0E1_9EURO